MTARCALYMGARKIFGSPSLRPRLLFPKYLIGFSSDGRYEYMRTKFEVRIFTHSRDNKGYPKHLGSP